MNAIDKSTDAQRQVCGNCTHRDELRVIQEPCTKKDLIRCPMACARIVSALKVLAEMPQPSKDPRVILGVVSPRLA